jgi:plasmid maintenance system antidote protein VapI
VPDRRTSRPSELAASQRATAKALGVDEGTVRKDLGKRRAENSAPKAIEPAPESQSESVPAENSAPAWFADGASAPPKAIESAPESQSESVPAGDPAPAWFAELAASQRATAKALGVNASTVNRDVADATPKAIKAAPPRRARDGSVADATPAWSAELAASQRATAKALGVDESTVREDLGKRRAGNPAPKAIERAPESQSESVPAGDPAPAWFADGTSVPPKAIESAPESQPEIAPGTDVPPAWSAELAASQRATAKALGVGKTTIQEDLAGRKRPPKTEEPPSDAASVEPKRSEATAPAWFADRAVDPAKLARGRASPAAPERPARSYRAGRSRRSRGTAERG